MADEGAADIMEDGGATEAPAKKGGAKTVILQVLKYVLIAVAAIVLIITITVITVKVISKNGKSQSQIPVSDEYTVKRESYDWYTSLDQIRTTTCDPIPASVSITIALGYKKEDKAASTEITERRIEIIDFLRRFFSEKTVEDLSSKNEEVLKQQIRDQLNDDILTNAKIKAVKFTAKDVIQQ